MTRISFGVVAKPLLRMAVLVVCVMVAGLLNPGSAHAQSCSGSNYQGHYRSDAWGVPGCFNDTYQCPSGGSWSNSAGKCNCLPGTPIWSEFDKACYALAKWADNLVTQSLFHQSEHPKTLCINDPYQSKNDGTQLVVNRHCDWGDPASRMLVENRQATTRIIVAYDNKCMDNKYSKQEENNEVTLYTCNDTEAQQWDFDDYVFHYHANPSFCLSLNWDTGDPNDGGKLVLAHCNGQGNQRFFEEVRSVPFRSDRGSCQKWCVYGRCVCLDY